MKEPTEREWLEGDEDLDRPPEHVPGQINLEGGVEVHRWCGHPVPGGVLCNLAPGHDGPHSGGLPKGMQQTSDGPKRIDHFTNTVEDAEKFERNS